MRRRTGFIHDEFDIKVLILFILRRLPDPITIELLADLTLCDDGISFFNFAKCVEELVSTEHVIFAKNLYSISGKGIRNGKAWEKNLPLSIRQTVDKAAATVRSTQKRDSMIKTYHKTNDDGTCMAVLSMSDGLDEIIKIELHSINEGQAGELEAGFQHRSNYNRSSCAGRA